MINKTTMLIDDFEDEVLNVLNSFRSRTRWNKAKNALRHELVALLKAKKYIFFSSGYARYQISTIGSSYLYDVPLYKRGHLFKFRGKRVRIVCTDSGSHSWRGYMVGVIGDSPQEKIIKKLYYNYSFPDYVHSHKVLYKSPRFMVLKSDKSILILSKLESSGYIKLSDWDSFLVDGTKGSPIATLNHNADGSFLGKVIGQPRASLYPSLREAIDTLKDRVWF